MVFLLVTIATEATCVEAFLSAGVPDSTGCNVTCTGSAMSVFGYAVPASLNVSALTEHLHATGVGEFNQVVIKDFAMVFPVSDFTTALPLSRDREVIGEPVDDIDVVNVLFQNMVPTQPIKIIPIAHLIFHFGLSRLAFSHPNATAIPIYLTTSDFSNFTVSDFLI